MASETELKLEVPPKELRRVISRPSPHLKRPAERDLVSVYFDTPNHKLARNGVSLRVRYDGQKRIQTVKSQGAGGSFRRAEWENEITGDVPNLRKAKRTGLEPLLTKKLRFA